MRGVLRGLALLAVVALVPTAVYAQGVRASVTGVGKTHRVLCFRA